MQTGCDYLTGSRLYSGVLCLRVSVSVHVMALQSKELEQEVAKAGDSRVLIGRRTKTRLTN
jgi:hypothetical protein